MGHVMTVPPPWIRLKGSLAGKGGRSETMPSVKTFNLPGPINDRVLGADDDMGAKAIARGQSSDTASSNGKRIFIMIFFFAMMERQNDNGD